MVAKGNEQWPVFLNKPQQKPALEPYLQGFAFSSTTTRLTRPLASQERIYGLGERTGTMDKRGQSFPGWNVDPPRHYNRETVSMDNSVPFYLGLHIDNATAYGVLIDPTGLVDFDI